MFNKESWSEQCRLHILDGIYILYEYKDEIKKFFKAKDSKSCRNYSQQMKGESP